jgi:ribosomal protein L21E
MKKIELLDAVALTEDIPEHKLYRGQVGTVVEIFNDGEAFEVEFADLNGRTYEMLAVEPSKLMVLQYEPEAIAA